MKHASKYEGRKGFHIVTNLKIYDVPEGETKINNNRRFDYSFRNRYYFNDIELFKMYIVFSKNDPKKYNEEYLNKLIKRITDNEYSYDNSLLDTLDDDFLYYGSLDNSRLTYSGSQKEIIKNKIFELNGIDRPKRK